MVESLKWYGDRGFLKVVSDGVYDADYFAKYVGYSKTELGERINNARLSLVRQFAEPDTLVVDIGIGCGQFVESRDNTLGYDVNPAGVEWLKKRNLFIDPYKLNVPAMTFWDSFEHIEDPRVLLDRCLSVVFMSIPIFRDKEHVLSSRHYRPDEHYHYFTREGLVTYMRREGWECVFYNDMESRLGREDIYTFAFRRSH